MIVFRFRVAAMLNYILKTIVKLKEFSVVHKNTKFSGSCIKLYFSSLKIYKFYTTAMLALVPVNHLNAQWCDVHKSFDCSFHPEEGGSNSLPKVNNDVKEHRVSFCRILKHQYSPL
jgi:hypothetical protein